MDRPRSLNSLEYTGASADLLFGREVSREGLKSLSLQDQSYRPVAAVQEKGACCERVLNPRYSPFLMMDEGHLLISTSSTNLATASTEHTKIAVSQQASEA